MDAWGPAPGDELDRYLLEAPLGSGAQGAVWLARHRALDSLHALKFVAINRETDRLRVRREGQVQARLDHQNVVPVTDSFEGPACVVLVMPYVAGPTLADWLTIHRPEPAQALALLEGILAGLAHAHAHGVVHRDLKPSNVLICDVDGALVPRIADFGIARDLDAPDTLTATGDTLGSIHYMAPEQALAARDADERADIFAVGCIGYELFAGSRAFAGSQLLDILAAKANGQFAPLSSREPRVPVVVAEAIEWCLRPRPEDRPESCDAVLAALRGAHLATPTLAVPARRPTRPLGVVAMAAGAAALLAAVALAAAAARERTVEYPHSDGFVLRLDGSSWVEVPASPALDLAGALTIAAWIRPEAWQYGDLFPVLDRTWRLDVLPDRMVFTAAKRTGSHHMASTPLGEWSHVAVTYAPHVREVRWYGGGRLREVRPYAEPLWDGRDDPALGLTIGASPFGRFEGAQGSLDDVYVYARELVAADVLRLARGEQVDTADLVGAWRFDEGEGVVARDSGPGGRDGRVVGAAQWRRAAEPRE